MHYLVKFARTTAATTLGPKAVYEDLLKIDWTARQSKYPQAAYWNGLRKLVSARTAALLGSLHHPFRLALIAKIVELKEP